MISSKKIQFVITLIAAIIFMPLFAAEPNEPNESNKPTTELKFEMSNSPVRWSIQNQQGKGPIRPEFMAEFFTKRSDNIPNPTKYGELDSLLQTNIGKTMSPRQKGFLETSSCYDYDYQPTSESPLGYSRIHLYAVSQEDAEKMVRAFIEQVNENAKERTKEFKERLHESEQTLLQCKKDLPQKESQLKDIEEAYKNIKGKTHQFSSDSEAAELAKKSIIEMDKTFNDLDIEMAGIQERIKSIEKYRNESGQSGEIRTRLHSMYIDLMIELSGLEAQKKVAKEIYAREQEFLSLYNKNSELHKDIEILNRDITQNQHSIEQITDDFKRMGPNILPADIYKNTVTIYPVADK